MSRIAKTLTAVAAGLVGLTLLAPPAGAEQQAQEYAPTMLVLDASGSMKQADPTRGTKMEAAKHAVRSFVTGAPNESKVGLTVYGTGTGSSDAEKAAGCQDVRVLRGADTIDKPALTAAVDGIQPSGYTPIGTSLRKAAEALPKQGPRSIVLVSDGEDTCAPPDPCEVARELNQQGAKIVMHAIGFGVDAKSRSQLTCIAQVTGGTYTDARDGGTLGRVLPRVTATALRNYQPAGLPITGTPAYSTAPVAAPGQYLDTIGQSETRFYAVDVPQGATAYFTGTMSFPRITGVSRARDINTLQLQVFGAGGEDCGVFENEMATSSSDGVALTAATIWNGAAKSGSGCRGGGRYYFALKWHIASDGMPERLPLELSVGVEPAVVDAGPAPVLTKAALAEQSGPGTLVTGGGSFNVAGTLAGSGRYTDTVRPGEFLFYRVRLEWGQGLAYRVHYGDNGQRGPGTISNVTTALYNPFRQEIDSDGTAYTGSSVELPSSAAAALVPVRYKNRVANDADARKQGMAGWYYIAVKVGPTSASGNDAPVPVRIDLTVSGNREEGPRYASPSIGGVFGENAPKQPQQAPLPAVGAQQPAPATSSTDNSVVWIIVAAAAGALLVAGIAGGLAIRRRRNRQSADQSPWGTY
ncbi:Ca-activated chloride channel family protein [Herbihabitans rhizosphaerae]|uniref:Ca-activated chloride channel family protein n=1 Tax=Herbihabitans rhizosphaerae TaxID=1872711 RepID=A0A4Q7L2M4_9PSEU|nr:VWA domain-containing protein [Herbihabitans rhizosphaerae]RZS43467.1 Ca-activated chloride channel family protein [Herbihabitans rhizosphaerae]